MFWVLARAMSRSATAATSRICIGQEWWQDLSDRTASCRGACSRLAPPHCQGDEAQAARNGTQQPGKSPPRCVAQPSAASDRQQAAPTLTSRSSNCFSTSFQKGVPAVAGACKRCVCGGWVMPLVPWQPSLLPARNKCLLHLTACCQHHWRPRHGANATKQAADFSESQPSTHLALAPAHCGRAASEPPPPGWRLGRAAGPCHSAPAPAWIGARQPG